MLSNLVVNEKSSLCLDISLSTLQGGPPSSITSLHYWLSNPRSGQILIEKTELDPLSNVKLTIPPEAHICLSNRCEPRLLIVRAEAEGFVKHEALNYLVQNFKTVPYIG